MLGDALFWGFFLAGSGRFATAFLLTAFDADFATFRTGPLAEVARFALARRGLALSARPLTDDLAADRRVGVRAVERLTPFVMGLLICGEAFNLKGCVRPSNNLKNEREFNTASLVNQRKKGSCGDIQHQPSSRMRPSGQPRKTLVGHCWLC